MKIDRLVKVTLFSAALSLVSIAALAQTTPAKEKRDKLEDKIDRKEDKLDRKENRAARRENVRDRQEAGRDKREDVKRRSAQRDIERALAGE